MKSFKAKDQPKVRATEPADLSLKHLQAELARIDVLIRREVRRWQLAGGNICNIIVSAAYRAAADGGKVSMEHLLHGARRELQKMGRLINEKDMANG